MVCCQAQIVRGEAAAAKSTADELLRLSEEHGLPQTRATAMAYLGWAVGQTDDVNRGMRSLEEGFAIFSRLGVRSHLCLMFCLLAETYLAAGQYQKGLEQADAICRRKVLEVLVQSLILRRSPPLHRPIIFGNVRADLCGTRAFGA